MRMRGAIEPLSQRQRQRSAAAVDRSRSMEQHAAAPPAGAARPLVRPDETGEVDTTRCAALAALARPARAALARPSPP